MAHVVPPERKNPVLQAVHVDEPVHWLHCGITPVQGAQGMLEPGL